MRGVANLQLKRISHEELDYIIDHSNYYHALSPVLHGLYSQYELKLNSPGPTQYLDGYLDG